MASVVTDSPNSRTVRWFSEVSIWRIWLWLVVCAPAAATARAREIVVSVFIAASWGATIVQKNGKEKPSQRLRLLLRRLGASQGNGSTRVFEQQIALPLVLKEKDPLLAFRAFRIGDSFDEECSPLIVKPGIAVDGLRHSNPNPLSASHLREGIDHLLRERLEDDRAGTCAAGDDCIHRLRPRPIGRASCRE